MQGLIYKSNTDHPWHLIEELPEEPRGIVVNENSTMGILPEYRMYNDLIKHAISNAVRVENQEVAEQVYIKSLKGKYPDFPEPDKVYPVEVSYEIIEQYRIVSHHYTSEWLNGSFSSTHSGIQQRKLARLLPCKEETREMTPIDPLTKAVFSLDIQRLRATQTDAEFRRLLFQMLDQKTINQKAAMNEETKTTATEALKAMASKVEITEKMKEYAIHEAAKDAFKILFVHFHGLGLKTHIDITFEQDGVKYQLLFKPLEAEIERLKEGRNEPT